MGKLILYWFALFYFILTKNRKKKMRIIIPQQYTNLVENNESAIQTATVVATQGSTKAPSIYFNTGSTTYPKIYVNTSTSLKNLYFKIS